MGIDAYERREQILNLRERLLVAERERLSGHIMSLEDADAKLRVKFNATT